MFAIHRSLHHLVVKHRFVAFKKHWLVLVEFSEKPPQASKRSCWITFKYVVLIMY